MIVITVSTSMTVIFALGAQASSIKNIASSINNIQKKNMNIRFEKLFEK